jgi:hypothetical protein
MVQNCKTKILVADFLIQRRLLNLEGITHSEHAGDMMTGHQTAAESDTYNDRT